jgi:hypothetical protein
MMLLIIVVIAFGHRFIRQKKGRIAILLAVIISISALVIAYSSDIFGIKTFVEDSSLYNRFFGTEAIDIDEDGRMENKLFFIEHMLDYPWGGNHLFEMKGYAHDIFLDTYDEASVFAFCAMIAFMINTFKHFISCLKDTSLSFAFRQIVLCVYTSIYIIFMLEPILQGMPWLFASFCLIDGYVGGIIKRKRNVDLKGVVTE